MSNEFDIDAPADMELLGGTFDDEPIENDADVEIAKLEADDANPEVKEEDEPAEEAKDDTEHEPEPEPEPANKRDPVIPRARFDEVNAKLHAERQEREALQAEVERLRSAQANPKADSVNVTDLEQQYFDAMLNGDKETAVQIRAQINADIEARAEAKAAERVAQKLTERDQQSALNTVVEQSIKAYPFLDTNSPEVNQQAVSDVVEWRDFYMLKGDSVDVALSRAVQKVAPSYAKEPEPEPKEPLTDKRRQAALTVSAKAASAQPPLPDAGMGNRAIPKGDSILGDQEKWEKAPEEERMRYLM